MVVGAHYDTKDIPGFVGANDGAAGTAILTQLARTVKPRRLRPTLVFIAFDGEESPPARPTTQFERYGLRGSKASRPRYRGAEAMILLDFVGEKGLRIPREGNSDIALWRKLRAAARRAGVGRVFPAETQGAVTDDHVPFIRQGVPSIDLIDFDYRLLPPHAATTCRRSPSAAWTRSGETRDASCCLDSEIDARRHPKSCCWPPPAATAPGSTAPSRRWSARWSCTARPCTCARRSCTTSTWSSSCASAARSSWRRRPRCPEGETVVFSAHGVAPSVHANAGARELQTIDATCPLVTKVHVEAKKFAAEGYTIVLIGHAGHEEVEGTMGEAPDHIVLIETEEDVDALEVDDPDRVAFISQTTLSVDETRAIILKLREKFPNITGPRTDDICYATTNRQMAVRQMAVECDLVLVIGSRNSSNSNRLVEVARDHGADSYLIDNETQVRGGVARGQARGGHLLRRQRARGAGAAPGRVLPRARHRGRLGVRGRPGGRALHAPEGDPEGAGGAGVNWKPCRRRPACSAVTVPSVS